LLHRDYHHVKEQGLLIDSKDGNFRLPQVNAYYDVAKMPLCDVIIIALKTTCNHLLSILLPPLIKPGAIILVLQNGLDIEQEIYQLLADRHLLNEVVIIGGLCFLCSNKIGPGHIHHLDYGQITLGEYRHHYTLAGITAKMKNIAADFENAGIQIELLEDLLLGRWKKLVWNIPYNGLSVVLNARTDELMNNLYTRQLVENLMDEVVIAAKSTERMIPKSFVEMMLEYTMNMKPYRTSMKIDFDEKRPLEIEAIFGNSLRKVKELGVELPLINGLYQQLKFLDSRQ
jgi:2-dehydropantoate 2-reductase